MYLCEHSHDPDLIQVRFILIFFEDRSNNLF